MMKYAKQCNPPKSTGRFHLIPFQNFPQDFQQEELAASFGIKTVGEMKL
jgi:hypothetical protein